MKALTIGVGGVGESLAAIVDRRDPQGEIIQTMVLADYDLARAQAVSRRLGEERFPAAQVDARSRDAVAALAEEHDVEIVCNLLPPQFNLRVMEGVLKARRHYLDTGMGDDPEPLPDGSQRPFHDQVQFDYHERFEKIGKLALLGQGVEPGMVDYLARYAADHFFDEVDEIGVRDGANLEIPGFKGMAFGFSIWTTLDECTCPAIVWEVDRGFYEVEAFSETEDFFVPAGIGHCKMGHVAHDEVIHMARNARLLKGVKRVTFKYGLEDDFIAGIQVLESLNLTTMEPVTFRGMEIAPRDFVAAVAPAPAELGKAFVGKTAAGVWVKGKKDGLQRQLYFYHVADNQETVAKYGTQAVVCQTAFTTAIALEMLATGKLVGCQGNPDSGVRSPEEFCADPYVALMADYEFVGGVMEMDSEYKRARDHEALTAPLM